MRSLHQYALVLLLAFTGLLNADELWWSAVAKSDDKEIVISIVSGDNGARWHAYDYHTGQSLNISNVQILEGGTSFNATIYGAGYTFSIDQLIFSQFYQCFQFQFYLWAFNQFHLNPNK